ncbi:uncharacterized protein LOC113272079 [Papaver somniferum]|uniref:uncharacterized protein LOC113272079 n=1 Tax=Papaver somniferum TaxID=3469 RepID=UPI000E6F7E92|nr:uncharacterized protein LOC113272079 [Papaver somniferum]
MFVTDPHEKHVYFISESLTREETRYKKIDKIALALLHASRRLKPYFQGRYIVVYSEYPLKRILECADDSNQLAIWSNFLGAYEIKYETRTAEKGHALAALLADFPVDDIKTVAGEEEELLKPIESATDQTGVRWEEREDGITDSMIVVNQFLGNYRAKEERMALYLDHMREMENEFDQFSIGQRPRLENRHADALAYLSSAVETDTTSFVVVDFQELPSISDNHFVLSLEHASGSERAATPAQGDTENINNNMHVDSPVIDDSDNPAENASDWRHPYIRYLTTSKLPEDEKLASKVKNNAWRYSMIEGLLYRKPVALEPFLQCISAEEGQQILVKAHEGICDNHSGGHSLAHMILTQGYFWSYMQKDAKEYALKYIVGPLPKAPGGVKFVLAATDYFTKWIEAVALVHVTRNDVKRFIWENIVCRFGIPSELVSDNGKQFDSGVIKDFCKNLNIRKNFSSPYYTQSNRQAEATNRVIMENLKKMLEKTKGKWTKELPGVLWSYQTTPKRSTGFSPFTLAYGTEAVIPTEVHLKTTKTRAVKSGTNDNILALDIKLLEEQREISLQQLIRYQQAIKLSYDRKVGEQSFKPREYVLKKTREATMEPNCGKLGGNWEGPYIVDRPASRGSYYLRNLDGSQHSKPWKPWNSFHLKKFYH